MFYLKSTQSIEDSPLYIESLPLICSYIIQMYLVVMTIVLLAYFLCCILKAESPLTIPYKIFKYFFSPEIKRRIRLKLSTGEIIAVIDTRVNKFSTKLIISKHLIHFSGETKRIIFNEIINLILYHYPNIKLREVFETEESTEYVLQRQPDRMLNIHHDSSEMIVEYEHVNISIFKVKKYFKPFQKDIVIGESVLPDSSSTDNIHTSIAKNLEDRIIIYKDAGEQFNILTKRLVLLHTILNKHVASIKIYVAEDDIRKVYTIIMPQLISILDHILLEPRGANKSLDKIHSIINDIIDRLERHLDTSIILKEKISSLSRYMDI